MIEIGNVVYLRRATDLTGGELIPGLVVDFRSPQVTIEFPDLITLLSNEPAGICYKHYEKLYRLPAKVQSVLKSRPRTVVRFSIEGDKVQIDGRETLRVSTATDNIPVLINADIKGRMLDVSGDGLAVVLGSTHSLGETLAVSVSFRDEQFAGKAIVCNLRPIGPGKVRYGLKPAPREMTFARGLQTVASTLQRERRQREVERLAR